MVRREILIQTQAENINSPYYYSSYNGSSEETFSKGYVLKAVIPQNRVVQNLIATFFELIGYYSN